MKCTYGHEGRNALAVRCLDKDIVADMAEDVLVSKLAETNLTPVAVGKKILHGVQTLAKQAVGLVEIGALFAVGDAAALDAVLEGLADEGGRGVPATVFRGHVVLHAIAGVNLELARVDRAAKLGVERTGITFLLGVASRIRC